MSIVLVTGSCGLVGSESVKFFALKGYRVIGIDNNRRKFFFGNEGDTTSIKKNLKKIKKYHHYNYDIRDKNSIKRIFKKYNKKIKLIIHAYHDWAKNYVVSTLMLNQR